MDGHHVADRPPRTLVGHSCVYVKIGGADEIHERPGDGSRDCWSLRRGLSGKLHGLDDDGIRHHSCSGMYCFDGPDGGEEVRIRPGMRNMSHSWTNAYFFHCCGMEGVRNSRHTHSYDHSP